MTRHTHVQHQVLVDIREMSNEELENEYGIEIGDTIWDTCSQREFKTLAAWATFIIDQDDDDKYSGGCSKMGGKGYYDDY